ncbi:ATP-binding protein [Bacillus songklensis]|uniref:histidine kinase n=2 Tax=Bacillus songklensis TaxID=1069116 RepID=A0ABV8BAL1_9BACI
MIIAAAVLILIFLVGMNVIASYWSTKRTIELSIATQSVQIAETAAASINVEQYKRFLANPTKNEDYWKIRRALNDIRKKTGALYVYTLQIDDPNQSKVLIAGFPDHIDYGIGEPCTVPAAQLQRALKGKTYFTSVIEDPHYGTYISAGAPIKDAQGKIVGYLGVDTGVGVLKKIEEKVLQHNAVTFIFSVLFVLIVLISFYMMQKWYQKELKREIGDAEATYQGEIHSIFDSVRSLRHDYLNHIQVLHGLLKLQKYEMAVDYMDSLIKEAKVIDITNMKVDHPALLVLFQTKRVLGQSNKTSVMFEIDDDSFQYMKPTDLIKILSNLIDNAMDAAVYLEEGDRWIRVACKRTKSEYVFEVENSGPTIPKVERARIFQRGYSTKPQTLGKVRGQGLSIVQETVEKYGGSISVKSSHGRTTFTVWIPVEEKN